MKVYCLIQPRNIQWIIQNNDKQYKLGWKHQ